MARQTAEDKQRYQHEYYLKHREKKIKASKENRDKNIEKLKQYRRDVLPKRKYRYHNDVQYKIKELLRGRLRSAVKGKLKTGSAVRDLGCSIDEFIKYIENQFKTGMSWDNHGKWHFDHIVALSRFDLTDRNELLLACHYTNIQPLWAKENIQKGNR